MKKPVIILIAAVVLATLFHIPVASAGSVSVSFSGERNVMPGQSYTYNYVVSMNNGSGFFFKIVCNNAEISGDTNPNYDCTAENSNITVSGKVNLRVNDEAKAGDTITISTSGNYTVINEMGIPETFNVSESYSLVVEAVEEPTPIPTEAPTPEPIPEETETPVSEAMSSS